MIRILSAVGKRLFYPSKRPPGPSPLELVSEFLLSKTPVKQHKGLEYYLTLAEKYGGIVYMSTLKVYLINNATCFEHILKTNHSNYKRSEDLCRKTMLPIFGDSVLISEGKQWRNRRRVASPFYQHNAIKSYVPNMVQLTQNFISKWNTSLPKKTNILTEMNHLALTIILKLTSNTDVSETTLRQLEPAIQFSNQYCSNLALPCWRYKPTIGNIRFRLHINTINTFFLSIIQKRRQHPQVQDDLLNWLLKAKHEEFDRLLNDEEVLAEFKTHVLTGHETTACALAWMWYSLAYHPHYQDLLHEELDAVLNGRPPTWEDVPKLKITHAILSETLRLYPSVLAAVRTSLAPDVIDGFEIPANASLLLNIHTLHRNPAHWENPNTFYPERFLEPKAKQHPFAYVPFAAGPHMCTAKNFAPVEMTLITALIAQHFTFHFPKKKKPTIMFEPCISLRPKNAIILCPKPRQKTLQPSTSSANHR